jgi:RNA polymerase sigma-70 factor (ECF subfamily)
VVERSDDDLLTATPTDPAAFGEFYRRHSRALTGYFVRRTRSPEMAADLVAETFAAALQHVRRFDPAKGQAVGWLYGIARRELADALERGRVEDRARRRMRIPRIALEDADIERIQATADSDVVSLLSHLPVEQRAAVEQRVLQEQDYAEIAAADGTTETVIRKRVSRGLAGLRHKIGARP